MFKLPSCEEPARRGGRGSAEGAGWLFFGDRILITFEDQKTTTPSLRSFPSRRGGQALRRRGALIRLTMKFQILS